MTGNQITQQVIGAAIAIHKKLGPGLLESTYEAAWPMNCGNWGFEWSDSGGAVGV
jgi:hypothetical protein